MNNNEINMTRMATLLAIIVIELCSAFALPGKLAAFGKLAGMQPKQQRCMKESSYVINVNIHTSNSVSNVISSLGNSNGLTTYDDRIEVEGDFKKVNPALKAFFKEIFQGLNKDLEKYGVQLQPVLIDPKVETVADDSSWNAICEMSSATAMITEGLFKKVESELGNDFGISLFVFGCVSKVYGIEHINIMRKEACGRIVGVLWTNKLESAENIKNAVLQAIGGELSLYTNSKLSLNLSEVCSTCSKCIGAAPNRFGSMLDGVISLVIGEDVESNEEEKDPGHISLGSSLL